MTLALTEPVGWHKHNHAHRPRSLISLDRLELAGTLNLAPTRLLKLDTPQLLLAPDARVKLQAANVSLGNSGAASAGIAQTGNGLLTVQASGAALDLFGHLQIGGAAQANLLSAGDLRLHGVLANGKNSGSLTAQAELTLSAAQVYGSSATAFLVDAGEHQLHILRGGDQVATPAAPLSAGASLTFKARDIVQDGVLRAPLGNLSLAATRSLVLTPSMTPPLNCYTNLKA